MSGRICGPTSAPSLWSRSTAAGASPGRCWTSSAGITTGGGIDTLYLLTDHEHFYERYGWEFFCHALGDGEETPSRLYRRLWRPDADRETDGYQLKSKP